MEAIARYHNYKNIYSFFFFLKIAIHINNKYNFKISLFFFSATAYFGTRANSVVFVLGCSIVCAHISSLTDCRNCVPKRNKKNDIV